MIFHTIGASGEVRKIVHRKTGMVRAVKMIKKSRYTKEETEKVFEEVRILRTLVTISNDQNDLTGSSKYSQNV
jgi:Protein kinase domain.